MEDRKINWINLVIQFALLIVAILSLLIVFSERRDRIKAQAIAKEAEAKEKVATQELEKLREKMEREKDSVRKFISFYGGYLSKMKYSVKIFQSERGKTKDDLMNTADALILSLPFVEVGRTLIASF